MHAINFSSQGLRAVLAMKKNFVKYKFGNDQETIKPTKFATYKNIVDVLDEMTINNITRYVLMDASVTETALVQKQ